MIDTSDNLLADDLAPRPFDEVTPRPVDQILAELKTNGIVVLPGFIRGRQLAAMQRAFDARLKRVRWNDFDGYERERFRHVVPDLLTIDQGRGGHCLPGVTLAGGVWTNDCGGNGVPKACDWYPRRAFRS